MQHGKPAAHPFATHTKLAEASDNFRCHYPP